MRRTIALVVLGTWMFAASRPADADAEPSCETVTTVRCTGSAAPLALPGNAPAPVAAQQIRIPAPPPVPQPLPPQEDDAEVPQLRAPERPACCAAAQPSYDPVAKIPGGWHLVQEGGELMLQRKRRTGIAGVWGPGLALWLVSYAGTSIGGVRDDRPWAAIPFFGGFVAGGIEAFEGSTSRVLGYTAGSLLQLGGFITFLVGVAAGEKLERMPLRIAPTAARDGGGLSLTARF